MAFTPALSPAQGTPAQQGQQAPPSTLPSAPSATLQQGRDAAAARQQQTQQPPAQPASQPQPAGGQGTAQPAGQGSPQPGEGEKPITIRANVNEVSVFFTVTDKHGHFVKDLNQRDIQILDDNRPPQRVSHFETQTNLPLRIGLLVDESNSIRDRFRFEQQAAIEFLSQVVRRGSDQAFVLGFDTTLDVAQDFTDDNEKLAKAVHDFRPGGGTALFDAIYWACREKLMNPPGSKTGGVRKAIIVVTDGEDNQSRASREEAIEMAQRAEVAIYAISTNISNTQSRGDKWLQRMADATGGRAFFPFKLEDVANHFGDIEDELRSQYAVFYLPADFQTNGAFHTISIEAESKKYHVRAKTGYYAHAAAD